MTSIQTNTVRLLRGQLTSRLGGRCFRCQSTATRISHPDGPRLKRSMSRAARLRYMLDDLAQCTVLCAKCGGAVKS